MFAISVSIFYIVVLLFIFISATIKFQRSPKSTHPKGQFEQSNFWGFSLSCAPLLSPFTSNSSLSVYLFVRFLIYESTASSTLSDNSIEKVFVDSFACELILFIPLQDRRKQPRTPCTRGRAVRGGKNVVIERTDPSLITDLTLLKRMDIEEELALNYGFQDDVEEEEEDQYEDSLEAEFALNYAACEQENDEAEEPEGPSPLKRSKYDSNSDGIRTILKESSLQNNILDNNNIHTKKRTTTPVRHVQHHRKLKDPLMSALRDEAFVVSSPTSKKQNRRRLSSISPGAEVVPHYELRDPLDHIFGENTKGLTPKPSARKVLPSIGLLSPDLSFSTPRLSLDSVATAEELLESAKKTETPDVSFEIANYAFRANARHRSDLDLVVGSDDVFLISATLFDAVSEHAIRDCIKFHLFSRADRCQIRAHVRCVLDAFVDIELKGILLGTDAKPPTCETMQRRGVRFRTFDLSTVQMPCSDHPKLAEGFERLLNVVKLAILSSSDTMSKIRNNEVADSCLVVAGELLRSYVATLRDLVNIFETTASSNGIRRSALRKSSCVDNAAVDRIRKRFPDLSHLPASAVKECRVASAFYAEEISSLLEMRDGGASSLRPLQILAARLIESQVRYALRCSLNCDDAIEATMKMISGSGSLTFNDYDLAAVLNRALDAIFHFDDGIGGNETVSSPSTVGLDDDIDPIARYLDACGFIVSLFSEPVLFERVRTGQGHWSTFLRSMDMARACGCDQWGRLAKFRGLSDMETFYTTMVNEKCRAETYIASRKALAESKMTKRQKKKLQKKKKKKRRRRSLSGKGRDRQTWHFPKLKSTQQNEQYEEKWVCRQCSKIVLNYNEGGEIACDGCGRWSHLKCLGLPEDYAFSVDSYYCPACRK